MNIKKSCPLCGCLLSEIVIFEREKGTTEEAEGSFSCSWCDIEFVIRGKSAEDIHDKWNAKFRQKAVQDAT